MTFLCLTSKTKSTGELPLQQQRRGGASLGGSAGCGECPATAVRLRPSAQKCGRQWGPSQSRGVPAHLPWDHLWSSGPGPREESVLSHRRGNELQLEVLILEDAVESRATLGATEWPVALAATVLGQFCEESQLQRRGHTSARAVGAENLWEAGCGTEWGEPESSRCLEYRRDGAVLREGCTGWVWISGRIAQTRNVTVDKFTASFRT